MRVAVAGAICTQQRAWGGVRLVVVGGGSTLQANIDCRNAPVAVIGNPFVCRTQAQYTTRPSRRGRSRLAVSGG